MQEVKEIKLISEDSFLENNLRVFLEVASVRVKEVATKREKVFLVNLQLDFFEVMPIYLREWKQTGKLCVKRWKLTEMLEKLN